MTDIEYIESRLATLNSLNQAVEEAAKSSQVRAKYRQHVGKRKKPKPIDLAIKKQLEQDYDAVAVIMVDGYVTSINLLGDTSKAAGAIGTAAAHFIRNLASRMA